MVVVFFLHYDLSVVVVRQANRSGWRVQPTRQYGLAPQDQHGGPWRRRHVSVVRVRIRHRPPAFGGGHVRGPGADGEEESVLSDEDQVPKRFRQAASSAAASSSPRRKQQQQHHPLRGRRRDRTHLRQVPRGGRAAGR